MVAFGSLPMIQFRYFRPRTDLRKLVSSYYFVSVSASLSDIMRAEIANVRFVLRGEICSDIGGTKRRYRAGSAMLCGPTNSFSKIEFSKDAEVLGAAITPLGWRRMLKVPAEQLADQVVGLKDYVSLASIEQINAIFDASGPVRRIEAANDLFAVLDDSHQPVHDAFLKTVTYWLTDPQPNELDDLLTNTEISHRQVERLCKIYFGCSPKRLHRKFRALHSANRLTWQDLTDWRDIATTAYFDQSHFIREFKQFNGRTPSEFIKGAHILVRQTLKDRLQIDHESPFSLVG